MITRSQNTTIVFENEFMLKAVGRTLPAGEYKITTEEEQIEYLSFPAFRRISTVIFVPTKPGSSSVEMYEVDPLHLTAAQERDVRPLCAAQVAPSPPVGFPPWPTAAHRAGSITPEGAGLLAARFVKSGVATLSSAVANAKRVLARARVDLR